MLSICCLRSSSLPWGHKDIGLYFFPETLMVHFLTYALNHLELILVCSARYRYIYVSRWMSTCPGNIFWMVQLSPLNWQTPLSCIKFLLMHGSVSKLSALWLFLCECHTNLVIIVLYYSLLFSKASLSPHASEGVSFFILIPLFFHKTFRISSFILKGCWDFFFLNIFIGV